MITTLSENELVELGSRLRAAYLVEQAGYTLGIAAQEGQPLADLLPQGFLAEVGAARDSVQLAIQDKTVVSQRF